MKCWNCGKDNPGSVRLCFYCGAVQEKKEVEPKEDILVVETPIIKKKDEVKTEKPTVKKKEEVIGDISAVKKKEEVISDIPAVKKMEEVNSDTPAVSKNDGSIVEPKTIEKKDKDIDDSFTTEPRFCAYCGKRLIDGKCTCSSYSAAIARSKAKAMSDQISSTVEKKAPVQVVESKSISNATSIEKGEDSVQLSGSGANINEQPLRHNETVYKEKQHTLKDTYPEKEKESLAIINKPDNAVQDSDNNKQGTNEKPKQTPYGFIPAYVVLALIGIIVFVFSKSVIWIVIAAVLCFGYWLKSYLDYRGSNSSANTSMNDIKTAPVEVNRGIIPNTQTAVEAPVEVTSGTAPIVTPRVNTMERGVCPKCGSTNITRQVFQENKGSRTITKTTSKYKEKGHGCLWWLCIGWWWWMIDLISWIVAFFPRLVLRLFAAPYKKKKYKGKSRSVSNTVNKIDYRTVSTCQNCGYTW